MAEPLTDVLRLNSTKSELERLQSKSRGRVPAPASSPVYTTLPDGRVLGPGGAVVFTPTPLKDKKQ